MSVSIKRTTIYGSDFWSDISFNSDWNYVISANGNGIMVEIDNSNKILRVYFFGNERSGSSLSGKYADYTLSRSNVKDYCFDWTADVFYISN